MTLESKIREVIRESGKSKKRGSTKKFSSQCARVLRPVDEIFAQIKESIAD